MDADYPDEDIEEMTYEKLTSSVRNVKEKISEPLSTADTGRIIREGLSVSIVGKPNVGKSSLMNVLMGENRAIVTDIPGTTRDIIEESMVIKNIPVVITDTAGIRDTEDIIEKIGIEESTTALSRADLIDICHRRQQTSRRRGHADDERCSRAQGDSSFKQIRQGACRRQGADRKRASFGGHNRDFSHRRPWN